MRGHYEDFRSIDRALRRGRLEEATALAFWLQRTGDRDVAYAARELADATTLPGALHAQAKVAVACGDCHVARNVTDRFERDTIAPALILDRHRWAAARVWDGIVGGSDMQWRAGLGVFANDLAFHTREEALRAISRRPNAKAYAELLGVCVTCHHR